MKLTIPLRLFFFGFLNDVILKCILTSVLCDKQEWVDYNLMWNHSEYGGVKDLRITPNKLWKPDVLMYNRSV